ncbi:MAG: hypothetical protein KKB30_05475 [Proteobacteria bacterium]|nr:hypothetical protein [Pseudomonadota bacterium]MBU1716150.1 hypothetical protein [Pseudomonadota bacterium]
MRKSYSKSTVMINGVVSNTTISGSGNAALRFRSEEGLYRDEYRNSETYPLDEVTYVLNRQVTEEEALELLNDLGIETSWQFFRTEDINAGDAYNSSPTYKDIYGYGFMKCYQPYAEVAVCALGEKDDIRTLDQKPPAWRLRTIKRIIKKAAPLLTGISDDRFKLLVHWLIGVADLEESALKKILPSLQKKFQETKARELKWQLIFVSVLFLSGLALWNWSWIWGAVLLVIAGLSVLVMLFGD